MCSPLSVSYSTVEMTAHIIITHNFTSIQNRTGRQNLCTQLLKRATHFSSTTITCVIRFPFLTLRTHKNTATDVKANRLQGGTAETSPATSKADLSLLSPISLRKQPSSLSFSVPYLTVCTRCKWLAVADDNTDTTPKSTATGQQPTAYLSLLLRLRVQYCFHRHRSPPWTTGEHCLPRKRTAASQTSTKTRWDGYRQTETATRQT